MGRRLDPLHQIEALDPERDSDEIFRHHALYEFPWDVTRALELALYAKGDAKSVDRYL